MVSKLGDEDTVAWCKTLYCYTMALFSMQRMDERIEEVTVKSEEVSVHNY